MNDLKKSELLIKLGPLTFPFRRINPTRNILKGEDKLYPSINCKDKLPDDIIFKTEENTKESTYLWVIDQEGNILILLEQTINSDSNRGHICHSNITGGNEAYQGGELWFIDKKSITINRKSGRYGGNKDQEKYIIEYFELHGYNVNIVPL